MRLNYPNLTWRAVRHSGETYRAELHGWAFALDKVAGEWRLRGWNNGVFVVLRYGKTAGELQRLADEDVQ